MPYRITENCKGCGHCVQWCPVRAIKGQRRVGYRIDAARCNDCGVCGRICAYSAVLTPNGAAAVRLSRLQWDRPHWDYQACSRCNLCIPACPVKCIQNASQDNPETGVVTGYPFLTRPRMCLGCGFCSQACPDGAIEMKPLALAGQQPAMVG